MKARIYKRNNSHNMTGKTSNKFFERVGTAETKDAIAAVAETAGIKTGELFLIQWVDFDGNLGAICPMRLQKTQLTAEPEDLS